MGNFESMSLNEMTIHVQKGLSSELENSIYYPKLKHALFNEIVRFCKERIELKHELHAMRTRIGEKLSEQEIRFYFDELKLKYNNIDSDTAINYHIEPTRLDFGVVVTVTIKRAEIYQAQFVFRYRKDLTAGIGNLTSGGLLESYNPYDPFGKSFTPKVEKTESGRKGLYESLMGRR